MFPTVQPRPFFATRATGHADRAVCCIVFPCGWETVACGSDNAPSRHSASRWTRLCLDMSSPVVDIVSNAEARTRYGVYPHQAGKGRRSPRCSTLYRMKQGPGASFLSWVSRLFEGEYRLPLVQRTSASPWHLPRQGKKNGGRRCAHPPPEKASAQAAKRTTTAREVQRLLPDGCCF